MFRLFIDPGWVLYAYAVDGLIAVPSWMGSVTPALYPSWAQCFPCKGFICVIPWTSIDFFGYPLGVPYMVQFISVLTLLFFVSYVFLFLLYSFML